MALHIAVGLWLRRIESFANFSLGTNTGGDLIETPVDLIVLAHPAIEVSE